MKEDKTHIFLIVLFILMITVPQVTFWLVNKEDTNISETENRTLASKPEFKFINIEKYPKEYEDYYNDHLPFREQLRGLWAKLNYDIFHTTIDNRTLLGKEDWFFYRENETIQQIQGISKFTQEEMEILCTRLQTNADKFKEQGIETYVLVLPNKENVYREYLPDAIKIKEGPTRTEELVEYIKNNSSINVVYPKQELLDAKKNYQVYRKYDTHWNSVGSLVGTIALQKAIDPSFSYNLQDVEIQITKNNQNGDLTQMNGLKGKVLEDTVTVKSFYPEIQYTVKNEDQYEEVVSNATNEKTVLFIGDSFRYAMKDHLAKLYSKVIYIQREHYTKDLVEKVKPDIIVLEIVERFSSELGATL